MTDIIKEVGTIAEEITNTTTPAASAVTLLEWIISLFQHIANSSNPAAAAAAHANVIATHKDELAAAVAANPS